MMLLFLPLVVGLYNVTDCMDVTENTERRFLRRARPSPPRRGNQNL
jgi:hypothetical protein